MAVIVDLRAFSTSISRHGKEKADPLATTTNLFGSTNLYLQLHYVYRMITDNDNII